MSYINILLYVYYIIDGLQQKVLAE